jgi:hypothetical protein
MDKYERSKELMSKCDILKCWGINMKFKKELKVIYDINPKKNSSVMEGTFG